MLAPPPTRGSFSKFSPGAPVFGGRAVSGKPAMSGISLALLATSLMCAAFAVSASAAAEAPVVTKIKPVGKFTAPNSTDDGKPRGISGMACLGQPADASRECFVINDEERFGEIANLTKDGLTATGKMIDFVAKGEKGEGVPARRSIRSARTRTVRSGRASSTSWTARASPLPMAWFMSRVRTPAPAAASTNRRAICWCVSSRTAPPASSRIRR
jgi:hypothetical protein